MADTRVFCTLVPEQMCGSDCDSKQLCAAPTATFFGGADAPRHATRLQPIKAGLLPASRPDPAPTPYFISCKKQCLRRIYPIERPCSPAWAPCYLHCPNPLTSPTNPPVLQFKVADDANQQKHWYQFHPQRYVSFSCFFKYYWRS